jgi:hypothetical protein
MILELLPGTVVKLDGLTFTVVEHSAYHEIDFRLDVVRLKGPTPAHTRWLAAVQPEAHPMVLEALDQQWLAPPSAAIVHEGEVFRSLYRGGAHLVRRGGGGRAKEGRVDYALFRADSGRVILTLTRNENVDAWVGTTVPADAIVTK